MAGSLGALTCGVSRESAVARPRGSAADLAHAPLWANEGDLSDRVARPFAPYFGLDGGGHGVVRSTASQDGPQVGFPYGEQAITEFAVSSESHAVTGAAEGLGHARDHADLASAVPVAPRGRR